MQIETIQTNIQQIKVTAPVKEKAVERTVKKEIPQITQANSKIQPVGKHSLVIITILQNGERQTYPNPKGLQRAEAMARQHLSQIAMTA